MATLKVGNNSQEVKDGENISAAAEAMGIPFSCHVGTCGTCLSSVESGRENLSEVTQEEFEAVMGYNPSSNQDNYSYPVTNVSWYDAIDYCIALSNAEGRVSVYSREGSEITWNDSANGYRLPTEAEWEFVCRANGGSGNSYCYGDDTDDLYHYAWYNTTLHITRDGDKFPNDFGVYGMHGNVWEWCWDWYSDYSEDAQTDPIGPGIGQTKVVRGGSYLNRSVGCRSSNRASAMPNEDDTRNSTKGFRVIRQ